MRSDFRRVAIESDQLRVVVAPQFGAKVISLLDKSTGREWLTPPEEPGYPQPPLGTDYSQSDKSGWDECFPSIAPGHYPRAPWREIQLADHGELWQRAWSDELSEGEIVNRIEGVEFPYRFERRLSVHDERLTAAYRVDNLADEPFACLWAMHPLFAAGPEARLVLPTGSRLRVAASFGGDLNGRVLTSHELERALDARAVAACKVFCDEPAVGRAALCDTGSAAWIGVDFAVEEIPFLGVWLNRGGWPPNAPLQHAALEPTTGAADDLAEALRRGGGVVIAPRASSTWQVSVAVGLGQRTVEEFVNSASVASSTRT